MPGLTARFTLPVATTEDDSRLSAARIAHIDTDPDMQLPKQNWLDAAEAARLHAEGKDDSDENTPVNIRLSFLPSFKAPESQRKAAPHVALAAVKPAPVPQPASDAAACAAVDAYNKRQLEAIQSDRHTLSALQAAITELGLKKQLNFMAGTDSKIDMPETNAASNPGAP